MLSLAAAYEAIRHNRAIGTLSFYCSARRCRPMATPMFVVGGDGQLDARIGRHQRPPDMGIGWVRLVVVVMMDAPGDG